MRRETLKWMGKWGQVAVLLAVAVTFWAPAAQAGSSANEIKNCPDQNWCSYHRTVDTA